MTIELPDHLIAESVRTAWKRALSPSHYGDRNTHDGWELACEAVSDYIRSPEFTTIIRDAARKVAAEVMPEIVREHVTGVLRKQAKKVLKEEDLFASH